MSSGLTERIRAELARRHWSQRELARRARMSHTTVSKVLSGRLAPSYEFCRAIAAHNEKTGVAAETKMAKALKATDPLTGLIVAATLVLPSKKMADLKAGSVSKRYKEKSFAANASREIMLTIEEIGLKLDEFFELALEAMQEISGELGL